MAVINWSSISDKAKAYSKTDSGKKKMSEAITNLKKSGSGVTSSGDEVLTHSKMSELAEEFIDMLKKQAASFDLAESVMEHFDSLDYMIEDAGNNVFQCFIYFRDDLGRESLYRGDNTSEGINNIVALFNNGYVASKSVYGYWKKHDTYVHSVPARPSLHFMQRSIEDFINKYHNKYNITAVLNDDEYDGNYAGSLNGTITKA